MSDKHAKKHKKQLQILKNRHTLEINQQAETLARGRDLEREREEELRDAATTASRSAARNAEGKPVWSAKLQMIRDKNTGRERMAKERWNRFAGTESGGGRGL